MVSRNDIHWYWPHPRVSLWDRASVWTMYAKTYGVPDWHYVIAREYMPAVLSFWESIVCPPVPFLQYFRSCGPLKKLKDKTRQEVASKSLDFDLANPNDFENENTSSVFSYYIGPSGLHFETNQSEERVGQLPWMVPGCFTTQIAWTCYNCKTKLVAGGFLTEPANEDLLHVHLMLKGLAGR